MVLCTHQRSGCIAETGFHIWKNQGIQQLFAAGRFSIDQRFKLSDYLPHKLSFGSVQGLSLIHISGLLWIGICAAAGWLFYDTILFSVAGWPGYLLFFPRIYKLKVNKEKKQIQLEFKDCLLYTSRCV